MMFKPDGKSLPSLWRETFTVPPNRNNLVSGARLRKRSSSAWRIGKSSLGGGKYVPVWTADCSILSMQLSDIELKQKSL
jgi:hypothetical protein